MLQGKLLVRRAVAPAVEGDGGEVGELHHAREGCANGAKITKDMLA